MKMGLGGMLAVEVYPVVLFKNGDALLNVRALGQPAALAEHQQSHPKEWTRWQRSGGKLQLMRSEGWKAMAFQTTTQRLPDNTRLNGRYRLLGGAGNSSQSVAAWAEWQFSTDGRFQRSGGAGGRTETSGGSLATASQASPQTGRYRIDGLQIHLQHDGGRSERLLILMDLNDPKSALWLNGQAHARQKD
ncbi:hypothetical protein [Ideonella sp.]|uniref:hypothetical protein n=1 Tax=Ideonella sp. TaxID=1929293 RepID=UPI003BB59981